MATCGSLHQIFELNTPLSNNPSSLIDSLSPWKQIKPSIPSHSFTEIFGELHFQENTQPTSSSSSPINPFSRPGSGSGSGSGTYHDRSESFSSMNSESLQLCTEGLGFESMDNIDDLKINDNNDDCNIKHVNIISKHSNYEYKNGKINERCFPPPISCIGKPGVCFRSYREEGRFILKEIRMPAQEILQACRKDGRLRLCFVHPKDDDDEDDGEYEEETEEYDEKIEENEEKISDEFDRGNS